MRVRALPAVLVLLALAAAPRGQAAVPSPLAGRVLDRLPTGRKVVALTIDCGGDAAGVASILRTLRATRATATFFLTGRFAETYPSRARRIARRYPVGNHTYSHPDLTQLPAADVVTEVRRAATAIRRRARRDPRPLFRFPYGAWDARTIGVVNSLGYVGIGWTVDTLGWEGRTAGQSARTVYRRVIGALAPGAIVLMHAGESTDGTTLDADALRRVIATIRRRGYRLTGLRPFLRRGSRAHPVHAGDGRRPRPRERALRGRR